MATNPTPNAPSACLKCATPMVAGAAFCGTCGTPAGSTGTPPLPPHMPPRPMGVGARQVSVAGDSNQAMQVAAGAIPAVGGEVLHHMPTQIGFRMGSYFMGRVTGTVDTFPEGPGRTSLKVTMKPDYSSLIPSVIGLVVVSIISTILLAKSAAEGMQFNPMNPYQMPSPGIGAYLQWWMIWLFDILAIGLAAWMLSGPVLEKRRTALLSALGAQAAGPQAVGGMPVAGGFAPVGFAPQVAPQMPPQFGAPAGAPPQVTPFEQLRKLAELRDAGSISAADYDQAKAAIIARM